jgi:hypothetical protein
MRAGSECAMRCNARRADAGPAKNGRAMRRLAGSDAMSSGSSASRGECARAPASNDEAAADPLFLPVPPSASPPASLLLLSLNPRDSMCGLEVYIRSHISRRGVDICPTDVLPFRQWLRSRVMRVLIDLIQVEWEHEPACREHGQTEDDGFRLLLAGERGGTRGETHATTGNNDGGSTWLRTRGSEE